MSDRSFKARFEIRCLVCDAMIEPGDWVCYDEEGQVVHEECHKEPSRETD
jgi:hypothetical protein